MRELESQECLLVVYVSILAGLGRWQDAAEYFGTAAKLAPTFSFAAANRALALYQLGSKEQAIR